MFNEYLWRLYKESKEGKEKIKYYSTDVFDEKEQENEVFVGTIQLEDKLQKQIGAETIDFNLVKMTKAFFEDFSINRIEDATGQFHKIISRGIPINVTDRKKKTITVDYFGGENNLHAFYEWIDLISLGLYLAHPTFYLPFDFNSKPYQFQEGSQFYDFEEICRYFEIPLLPPPGKKDKEGKAKYYAHINKSLYEFRELHGLTPAEMCAFLYDFAVNVISKEFSDDLPQPSKAWILKSKVDFEFLDNATEDSFTRWDGNTDTKRGDILLIYCMSPRMYVHSIWRAYSGGFVDPFFHYHNTVIMGSPIKTVPIEYKELAEDPVIYQIGAVRGKMQGAGGVPLNAEQYNAILGIMERKGQDIKILPQLEPLPYSDDIDVYSERDVEEQLVEPFLFSLDYTKDDWIRQMPIKMGRGERLYPDYAIGANPKRGEESAKMILEAKFQIGTERALKDAFYQAQSYALRLRSKTFILASKEGIWIYESRNGDFNLQEFDRRTWNQLAEPDVFHEMMIKIGRKPILR